MPNLINPEGAYRAREAASQSGALFLIQPYGEEGRWVSKDDLPQGTTFVEAIMEPKKQGETQIVYVSLLTQGDESPDGTDMTKLGGVELDDKKIVLVPIVTLSATFLFEAQN